MRRLSVLPLLTLAAAPAAFGDNWTGKLLDAACYERMQEEKHAQPGACIATAHSTAFVVVSSGSAYRLDSAGNVRAATALKNRGDRTTPGRQLTPVKEIQARVEGTESGGTIRVSSFELQ
jgi:hypothetical protein